MTSQPSLFAEFDTPQSLATHAVLVRSHLHRVKGEPITTAPSNHITTPHNGQATSQAAAQSLTTEHLQNQERRVLDALRSAGKRGMIREELARATGLEITDVGRCVNGLAAATRGAQRAGRVPRVTDGPDTRKSTHNKSQKIVRVIQ